MRLLAILRAVIQFSFAFHAMKTGRGARWIMVMYRYGLLLKRLGRDAEAQALFKFIDDHSRRTSIESESEWVRLAARERPTGTP